MRAPSDEYTEKYRQCLVWALKGDRACSGWVIFGHFWNVYTMAAALLIIRLRSFVYLFFLEKKAKMDRERAREEAIHWERAKKQQEGTSINDVSTGGGDWEEQTESLEGCVREEGV